MKALGMIFGLSLLISPIANASLTQDEEKAILREINNHCDDHWCESGNINQLQFQSFQCNDLGCALNYLVAFVKSDAKTGTCQLSRIHSFSDAVAPMGQDYDLTQVLVEDLDQCLKF